MNALGSPPGRSCRVKGKLVLLKIGGKAAENEANLASLAREMLALSTDRSFILVHGGGAEVTSVSKKLGITTVFSNGLRQTTAAEMEIVDMVLAGKINKQLVRLFRTRGLDAVGLSGADGGILEGKSAGTLPDGSLSRTGDVVETDDRLLILLLEKGFLPGDRLPRHGQRRPRPESQCGHRRVQPCRPASLLRAGLSLRHTRNHFGRKRGP